jgi:hypothetical protein
VILWQDFVQSLTSPLSPDSKANKRHRHSIYPTQTLLRQPDSSNFLSVNPQKTTKTASFRTQFLDREERQGRTLKSTATDTFQTPQASWKLETAFVILDEAVRDEHGYMTESEGGKAQNGWDEKEKPFHTSVKHMVADCALWEC